VDKLDQQALCWIYHFPHRRDEFRHPSARLDPTGLIVVTLGNPFIEVPEHLTGGCGVGRIEDRNRCRNNPPSIVQSEVVTSPLK
jgi:hypothetical protein